MNITKRDLFNKKTQSKVHKTKRLFSNFLEETVHLPMASSVPIFRSTKETTNYARLCRLLVDVGSQVLRQKFDSICPPATLNSYLSSPAVQTTLRTLKARRVLNPSQWDKLYPPVGTVSVSSRDFDITLLMVLLRNICGLTTPASG